MVRLSPVERKITMSAMPGRNVLRCLLVACCALSGGAALAQQKGRDLLEEYKQKQAVAAQKVESDVRGAILDAQKLLATDPAMAVTVLERALHRVEDDLVLTASRREALVKDVKDRLAAARLAARRVADRGVDRDAKRAVDIGQRTAQ
jgi:hypothetical protein